MDFIKIILTTLLSVLSLFIITKIMGHKQVAQLDFFDYVCGITIGSIGAELATDLKNPWQSFASLVLYGIISYLLSWTTRRFPKTGKYINGTPTILMYNGKLYRDNFKKAKLDVAEFLLLCREQGYFDLSEIQMAVFEHNGKLSVLPVSDKRPLTPSDMNLTPEEAHIGVELISDGRILGENISRMGYDEKWLKKQLEIQGYSKADEIFLAIFHPENKTLVLYSSD